MPCSGGVPGRGVPGPGGLFLGGACSGGVCSQGVPGPGGVCSGGEGAETPPKSRRLLLRTVRILLERILVEC